MHRMDPLGLHSCFGADVLGTGVGIRVPSMIQNSAVGKGFNFSAPRQKVGARGCLMRSILAFLPYVDALDAFTRLAWWQRFYLPRKKLSSPLLRNARPGTPWMRAGIVAALFGRKSMSHGTPRSRK